MRGAALAEQERAGGGGAWSRRLPVGAEPVMNGGVHFRVWAPGRQRVEVVFEDRLNRDGLALLGPEPSGYFSGHVADAWAGLRYRYRLDDDATLYPDPASRFQPSGPHGPSEILDPSAFRWTDGDWQGAALEGQVIYELHIGTFTVAGHLGGGGTPAARAGPARRHLPRDHAASPTSPAASAGATTA